MSPSWNAKVRMCHTCKTLLIKIITNVMKDKRFVPGSKSEMAAAEEDVRLVIPNHFQSKVFSGIRRCLNRLSGIGDSNDSSKNCHEDHAERGGNAGDTSVIR